MYAAVKQIAVGSEFAGSEEIIIFRGGTDRLLQKLLASSQRGEEEGDEVLWL